MYGEMTKSQKDSVIKSFKHWKSLGCNTTHASACAVDALKLSKRTGEKTRANAWAAVLATLVMAEEITVV